MASRADHAPDGTWYELSGSLEGETIVLAHGVGLDRRMWDAQVRALEAEYPVLRYDMLGHGRTPALSRAASLGDFTQQLLGLLRHLDLEHINLVGFSLGGIIAQRFAVDHPERVSRLVLMNTFYRRRTEEIRGMRERLRLTEEQGLGVMADLAIARWFSPAFQKAHPEITAAVHERLMTNDPHGYLCAYRVLVEADREIGDALLSVACPTLVMTGAEDVGSTPEMARRMAHDLHDARVAILDRLRHMAPVEDPERVNTVLLEFLRESPR